MAFRSDPGLPDGEQRSLLLAERLREAERRAVTFRVASAIGHLIGTPLNVIAGRAALIRTSPDTADPAEQARRIEEQVERLALEVRRLIEFLTPPEPGSDEVEPASVIADAILLTAPLAAERSVKIDSTVGAVPSGHVDSLSTLLVLTTLLSAASRSAPDGQTLRLAVREPESGEGVLFQLTAPKMPYPRGRIDRLEPPAQPGGGNPDALQALSVCFAVAQRRGGSLRVEQNGGRGNDHFVPVP